MAVIDLKAYFLKKIDIDMAIRYVAEKTSALTVNDPMHYEYFRLTIKFMKEGGPQYYKSIEQNFDAFFACVLANNVEYRRLVTVMNMELDFYMSTGNIEKARKVTKRNKLFGL